MSKACLSGGSSELCSEVKASTWQEVCFQASRNCPDTLAAPGSRQVAADDNDSIKFEDASTHNLCDTRSFRRI